MTLPLRANRDIGTAVSLRCQTGRHELCHGEAVNNAYEWGPCQCECHHAPRPTVDPDTHRDAVLAHIEALAERDELASALSDVVNHYVLSDAPEGAVIDRAIELLDRVRGQSA